MKLGRMAKSVASGVNTKQKEKGLLPRPVIQLISCFFLFSLVHLITLFVKISMS
jgi:hypothetical protein